jgi:hypothetical protein
VGAEDVVGRDAVLALVLALAGGVAATTGAPPCGADRHRPRALGELESMPLSARSIFWISDRSLATTLSIVFLLRRISSSVSTIFWRLASISASMPFLRDAAHVERGSP